jgi:predicted phosphodiesterase
MIVGLISDTHVPRDAEGLPPQVSRAFDEVDLILHGGDVYVSSILDELEAIAPVLAARGDPSELCDDPRVKDSPWWLRSLVDL